VLQGLIMIWGSKVGKQRLRDKMINSVSWRGDEVLDVGCGHGLMLIGAAKRLTTGHALGIDIWQQEDQASNSSRATHENAPREGVADRVELRDSDARQLPFLDESFDVVLSRLGGDELDADDWQLPAWRRLCWSTPHRMTRVLRAHPPSQQLLETTVPRYRGRASVGQAQATRDPEPCGP